MDEVTRDYAGRADNEKRNSTAGFADLEFKPGAHIGHYKLLNLLGEGGFALVYLAEQQEPIRRRVALKVIKPGMDSKQIIARFEAERQALAMLDHPNISQVYDAGTTDRGHPYFIMEWVKGLPITEHCDKHRLSIEERLRLFLQICDAVQYAHQKGIIHRDVKPSNLLVSVEAETAIPKVIDFGVAKAIAQPLTERTLCTEMGQFVGTPEYMSPEQAAKTAEDVDTRSDIYALGVLLYVMTTGVLPFDTESLREGGIEHIREVVINEEPRTPSVKLKTLAPDEGARVGQCRNCDASGLRRRIRGDLDWIILKAMQKDRSHRYRTAHALAEDIQRHLNHEPVLAGPPSKIYRLSKLLRKYRAHIVRAGIAGTLLAIIAVILVMLGQAVKRAKDAEESRDREILSGAQQLRSSRQFQNALTRVETIRSSKYVGLNARLLRARLILELQGPEAAVGEIEELLSERSEIACPAHFLLAWIYKESDSRDPETLKEYQQKAKEHEEKGERLFTQIDKSAEVYFNRAMIALTAEKTLEDLNRALELDPKHYDALKSRALAYYALRDYWRMQKDAFAMTALQDRDPLGYSLLAIALRERGDSPHAVECHNKAITLSPDDAELYSQRYETYFRMGDYKLALKDARRCVEIEPEQFVYCFNLFAAQVSSGDFEAARKQYREIVNADSAHRQQFEEWVKRHVFEVLGSGQSLELPEELAHDEAFSAMRQAANYYHRLEARATRLISGVYGQSAWSPSGEQLAYGRSDLYAWQPKMFVAGAPGLFRSSGIEILDLKSGITRVLVSFGKDPAWSPDGKHIAFVREPYGVREYEEEVWIIPAKGGEPRKLADGGWPIWTNDPNRLYFHSHSRTDNTLYSIRIDDPACKPIPEISCPSWFPWVSPDGKHVAYNEDEELKIVEIATGVTKIHWVAPEPVSVLLVRWKPDGKELSIAGPGNSDLGLWIFDITRRKAWQIFDPPATSGIWSRDGLQMVVEVKMPFEENWLVELDPNIPTYEALGSVLSEGEYLRHRRNQYADAIKSDPSNINVYISKLAFVGAHQHRIGEYEDALETLSIIEKLRGWTSPADVALTATALHQLGRKRQAQAALDQLRSLFRDGENLQAENCLYETEMHLADPNSPIRRIWEHMENNQLREAFRILEELRGAAVESDTEAGRSIESAVRAVARAYYRNGRKARDSSYAETFDDYQTAIQINPNFARAHADLGWLRSAYPKADFYDRSKGIKSVTRACELTSWNDCRYISTLADVYARLGEFNSAVKWQRKAIDLLSEDGDNLLKPGYERRLALYKSNQPFDLGNPRSFSTGRMIAWWKLDEHSGSIAADSSGNANDGKLLGDAHWKPSGGKIEGALDCDGDGDYIRVSNESSFDCRDEITVAAWVNITEVPAEWTSIITKGNSSWRLTTYRTERKFHFAVSGVGLGPGWLHGTTEVAVREWCHVAGTYDGAHVRLYVNGQQEPGATEYTGGITANNADVYIGGNSEKPERSWHGLIDDVRIYNYALSEAEINALCGRND